MRRVIVESPFAGNAEHNLSYLYGCLLDCLRRGEAPFASHALYPLVVDDDDPAQRAWSIAAGLEWGCAADASAVYVDLGVSRGMRQGIERARRDGRVIEYRSLETGTIYKEWPL